MSLGDGLVHVKEGRTREDLCAVGNTGEQGNRPDIDNKGRIFSDRNLTDDKTQHLFDVPTSERENMERAELVKSSQQRRERPHVPGRPTQSYAQGYVP